MQRQIGTMVIAVACRSSFRGRSRCCIAIGCCVGAAGHRARRRSPPRPITTADIADAGPLTLFMTDQIAVSDTCSFTNGSGAEQCQGFLDSPPAEPSGAAARSPAPCPTIAITSADGLQTPATGKGPWTETLITDSATVTASGVPSDLGLGFDDGACGTVSARSEETYQGSIDPGTYVVSGLQAVTDSTGAVTDLALTQDETSPPFPPGEHMRETDTLISGGGPNHAGCSAGSAPTTSTTSVSMLPGGTNRESRPAWSSTAKPA